MASAITNHARDHESSRLICSPPRTPPYEDDDVQGPTAAKPSSVVANTSRYHQARKAPLANRHDPNTPRSSIEERGSGADDSPRSVMSPPYWVNANSHQRSVSNISSESILPVGAIRLRDNDNNDHENERNQACWAKSVEIVDHTVVNGNGLSVGSFIVWIVRVEMLSGNYMNIRKRYSEFDDFRRKLIQAFPTFKAAMPELPPKSIIFKFRPSFLEKRRIGLQYFLNCIILNPEFSGSPVLKEFLFA